MFAFLTNVLLVALLTGNLGGVDLCRQSGGTIRRLTQVTDVCENERICEDAWEIFWEIDQPSHLNPIRVHGGLAP